MQAAQGPYFLKAAKQCLVKGAGAYFLALKGGAAFRRKFSWLGLKAKAGALVQQKVDFLSTPGSVKFSGLINLAERGRHKKVRLPLCGGHKAVFAFRPLKAQFYFEKFGVWGKGRISCDRSLKEKGVFGRNQGLIGRGFLNVQKAAVQEARQKQRGQKEKIVSKAIYHFSLVRALRAATATSSG